MNSIFRVRRDSEFTTDCSCTMGAAWGGQWLIVKIRSFLARPSIVDTTSVEKPPISNVSSVSSGRKYDVRSTEEGRVTLRKVGMLLNMSRSFSREMRSGLPWLANVNDTSIDNFPTVLAKNAFVVGTVSLTVR